MQSLNVRTILILVIVITTISIIFQNITVQLLLILTVLIMIFAKNISYNAKQKTFGRLINIAKFIIPLMILQIIFRPQGKPVFHLAFIKITDLGISYGVSSSLRYFLIILVATLLSDFSYKDYLLAFNAWKFPYEISFLISNVIYFIPIFKDEIKNTMEALRIRGIELNKIPLSKRFLVFSDLVFPTLAKAFTDIKKRAVSLDLKGFRLHKCRTVLHNQKLKLLDIVIQISAFIIFCGIIYYKWFFA